MKTFYLFLTFQILLFASCTPENNIDKCLEINCNFGNCEEGKCICDSGYEGINCDTISRDKFIGYYTIFSQCQPELDLLSFSIKENNESIDKILVNFSSIHHAFPLIADATVNLNKFTISPLKTNEYEIFEGSGTLNSNGIALSMNIKFNYDSLNYNCHITGIKEQ